MDPDIDIGSLIDFLRQEATIELSVKNGGRLDKCDLYRKTCSSVLGYVIQFLHISEKHAIIAEIILRLNNSAKKGPVDFPKIFMYEFIPHVKKFFEVPSKISFEDKPLAQNEILASFMEFLLQILNSEANKNAEEEKRYIILQKEMRFLLCLLGDIPFQCTQLQDLKALLAEFATISNQAGNFIYDCLLSVPFHDHRFIAGRDARLQKLEHFYAKIERYCINFSNLAISATPRAARAIDSLFIIDSLLEDLEHLNNQQFQISINKDMKDQLETLHEVLILSMKSLKNTIFFPKAGSDVLKECVNMIRDHTYEIEYLIKSYIVGSFPTWFMNVRLPDVIQKLKLNVSRLQKFKGECEGLQVTEDFNRLASLQPMESAKTVVEVTLVGFEEIKANILGDLIRSQNKLQIISIIGMPGLGKTTVAKNLFDSSMLQNYFYGRAWSVISQIYEKKKVFVQILMSISKGERTSLMAMSDEDLGLMIYQVLKQNRYIIMFDDVWSLSIWDEIKMFLLDDNNGSRIVFTSRIKNATPQESIFYTLPLLSEVDSFHLLVKKIFQEKPCPPQLQGIGESIARKCHGLPLAIVVVAGVLSNLDNQKNAWEKVEMYLHSSISNGPSGCSSILQYSYEHLPNHLKLCYLYLGTFPEDTDIPVQKLIWLWIAEGFVPRQEGKNPEDAANEYLSDLVNRSLVLVANRKYNGGIKACGIHDLLRDMCVKLADKERFMKSTKKSFSIYTRHRHLHVNCTSPSLLSRHYGLHCRSFAGHLPDPSSRYPQMPLLRVMDLVPIFAYRHSDHLKGIDVLVHLRYLTVHLLPPYQIATTLVNLECLTVESPDHRLVHQIHPNLLSMVKLKHLNIRHLADFRRDCSSSQPSNLLSLSKIQVFYPQDMELLKRCPHLRKLKCKCDDSLFSDISSLTKLESLQIRYAGYPYTKFDFPSSIKKLTIYSVILQPWERMSVIGKLPNLEVLKLFHDTFTGSHWEARNGEFQKLRFLKLTNFDSLNQWTTCSEHFPQLQQLMLKDCYNLKNIPIDMGKIPAIQTIDVDSCSYETCISAVMIEKEQTEVYGNEDLTVIIRNSKWTKEQLLTECTDDEEILEDLSD